MGGFKRSLKRGAIRLFGIGIGLFILVGGIQAIEEGFSVVGLLLLLLSALCLFGTCCWARSAGSGGGRKK